MNDKIPVSVFMGFLGSGKTTIILNLLKQINGRENIVMLKNEFGDVAVDTKLAQGKNVEVKEVLNGCLCCVLVGKLQNALNEILDKYKPDRILFESSGTAYPAPIVWEINKNERLHCDGVITVIDAVNFSGYKDKSYTAALQAQYTDLIVINKTTMVDDKKLDKVLDDVYDLNPRTPKIKTSDGILDASLVFGLTARNKDFLLDLMNKDKEKFIDDHLGGSKSDQDTHEHIETFSFKSMKLINEQVLVDIIKSLNSSVFYRIKGFYKDQNNKAKIINCVFGKVNIFETDIEINESQIVFMGREVSSISKEVIERLNSTQI